MGRMTHSMGCVGPHMAAARQNDYLQYWYVGSIVSCLAGEFRDGVSSAV